MSYTDGCTSQECSAQLGAASSLSQGQKFVEMGRGLHGGRRATRKDRKNRRIMYGGMADFPSSFDALLPQDMHGQADIGRLDQAFSELPQFVGKYGMQGGKRKMRGGVVLAPAEVGSSAMIISPQEEGAAFLNPQWYNENQVVPSFKGPENAYAAQQYANQTNYAQKAGTRKNRKNSRKDSRKNRKNSRKNRKANRKNSRKSNRKANRKDSRKANRKDSRKNRKNSRKDSRKANRKH